MFPLDEIEIKRSSCFCSKISRSSSSSNLQARNPARDNMLYLACHQLHWPSFGGLAESVCSQHDNRLIHILGDLLLLICLLLLLLLVPWPSLHPIGYSLPAIPSLAGRRSARLAGCRCIANCHRVTCTDNPIGLDLG
jgi:hypothetical protein